MGSLAILVENKEKLQLDNDAVRKIFNNPQLSGKKICIISISGSYRKGKSFMLNIILRYLRNDGLNNKNWMGKDDAAVNENGFITIGGIDAVTSGIHIHQEIFTIMKDGEEIAIMLMDTQGLFGFENGSNKDCNIFALSTILSSVQIYNLFHEIEERDIQYFELFTEYARTAKEGKSSCKQFQALTFLIRDWIHTHNFDLGMHGGREYLDNIQKRTSKTMEHFKHCLRENFEETNCCLLPRPGDAVERSHPFASVTWDDIGKEFLDETEKFIDHILNPKNLRVKCINGQPIPANAIIELLERSIESLNSGKLPKSETILQSVEKNQNLEAMTRSSRKYRDGFLKLFENDCFHDDDTMKDTHAQLQEASFKDYNESTIFGGETSRSKYRRCLQTYIGRDYIQFTATNSKLYMYSESKVSEAIQGWIEEYVSAFEEYLEAKKYLDDDDLESQHVTRLSVVFEKFEGHDVATKFPAKREYLETKLKKSFQKLKRDNEAARRFHKEQDTAKKNLLEKEDKLIDEFRRILPKKATKYMDEQKLKDLCDLEVRKTVDIHIAILKRLRLPHGDMRDKFDLRMTEEVQMIIEKNRERKKFLQNHLDAQYNRINLQYRESINLSLQGRWMLARGLRKLHNTTVAKLMDKARSYFDEDDLALGMVEEYLDHLKKALEKEYEETFAFNRTNCSVFGFLREYVSNIVNF